MKFKEASSKAWKMLHECALGGLGVLALPLRTAGSF